MRRNKSKTTKKSLELLIPAKALEHHHNPEFATLRDKIIYAVLRWCQKQDFSADVEIYGVTPFVDVQDTKFSPDPLGYKVQVLINC